MTIKVQGLDGVHVDSLLLLKPDVAQAAMVRKKIAYGLTLVRNGIDLARAQGRHVLYLPGSYDLVHLGHAMHIELAVEHYLSLPQHAALTPEDVFVLALADDDDLIAAEKSYKNDAHGGSEPFARPVQSASEYRGRLNVVHWRLFELASLPRVQMVGFIPSPLQMQKPPQCLFRPQREPDELPELLAKFRTERRILETDLGSLEAAIGQYRDMLLLLQQEPSRMVKAFLFGRHPWSIQAWQLFVHCYLGAGIYEAPMTRIMSHRDDVHGYQVGFLMQAAGIRTLYINEMTVATTTGLLEAHGPQLLLNAKRANYRHV